MGVAEKDPVLAKHELSVAERVRLMVALPATGNFITMKIVRDLRADLEFSDQEVSLLGIKMTGEGRVTWDAAKAAEAARTVTFGPTAQKLVRETLEKLNDAGEITLADVSLCEKFLTGGKE